MHFLIYYGCCKPSCKKSSCNIYQHILKFEKFNTMIFTKFPEKSKCKVLAFIEKIYMKCFHVELYSESTKKFTNKNTKIIYKIIFYLLYL